MLLDHPTISAQYGVCVSSEVRRCLFRSYSYRKKASQRRLQE
jgi:hypothetical protein